MKIYGSSVSRNNFQKSQENILGLLESVFQ